jgi:hypothetical protein
MTDAEEREVLGDKTCRQLLLNSSEKRRWNKEGDGGAPGPQMSRLQEQISIQEDGREKKKGSDPS